MLAGCLRKQPNGLEVDIQDLLGTRSYLIRFRHEDPERSTHVVPVLFREEHARRTPLYTRAVDEDINGAAHCIESFLEEALYCSQITQIAEYIFDFSALLSQSVDCHKVGLCTRGRLAQNDADSGTSIRESFCASRANACIDKMSF